MSLLKPIFGFCFQTIVEFICLKVTWYTIFDIWRICSVLILPFNVRFVFFLCSHRDNLLTFPYYRDVARILVPILRFILANTRIILNTLKFSWGFEKSGSSETYNYNQASEDANVRTWTIQSSSGTADGCFFSFRPSHGRIWMLDEVVYSKGTEVDGI